MDYYEANLIPIISSANISVHTSKTEGILKQNPQNDCHNQTVTLDNSYAYYDTLFRDQK